MTTPVILKFMNLGVGTGYEIFRNQCLERLTKQRTKDLENYLQLRTQEGFCTG
ncbi:MAG: hypothetical protein KatS3mg066_2863 [Fischerella sp.]|nr:MAG: hypothetical protein KatS3mg066_2863 [Fischerella sp.]